ncbi:GtrA family protein [Zoogloea sp. LCSB751]|uniref:GtrA family protein n=1 Tax=Zoogloea sp. LCSB751 TaxID=1965277 RepID=UPI0009A4F92E|nr:GtrA family protein [Zoogloea sp. LCSB751]
MIQRQFLIYLSIGVLSALLDIAVMEGLIRSGVFYGTAVSAGFVAGLVFNYLCHAKVTFGTSSSVSSAVKYGIVVSVNYGITMAFVTASHHWLGNVLAGKIVSLPVISVIGFLLGRYWIFRRA